jgi:hypothetical protein
MISLVTENLDIRIKGNYGIPLTCLILPHFCACLKPEE